MSKLRVKLPLAAAVALSVVLTVPAFADSQARVVRLSEVQGDVQIDRDAGQGLEKAFLNLPITQGAKLRSKNDGRAEVEFEDGSTLRVAPDTVIDFAQLSLRDSGTKVSGVHLQAGTVYVNFSGAQDSEFTLMFAHEKIALTHSAHLRVDVADTAATVAVFHGEVQVNGDSGIVAVSKNHSASFDLTNGDAVTVAKDLQSDPLDAWDKQQDQYHQEYSSKSYSNYSPYAYGTSDLNYYGSFFNAPGYGMMWQPYFAGAGWDPFMNGAWAFAPGLGYGWVSGYPWGWTPYHYGSWLYLPNQGWAWLPGGSWAGWTQPRIIHPPSHFIMPQPPSGSGHGTVTVNRGTLPIQFGKSFNRLEIPDNSAGLGIPRGGIRDMSQLSHKAQHDGFATAKLHTAPAAIGWGHQGFSAPASYAGGMHRGIAPASGHSSVGHSSPHR
jgi:hypothetical protein